MQKVNEKNIIKDNLAAVCDGASRAGVRLRIWFPALAVTAPLSCQPGGVQDICLALLLLLTNGLFQLCSRGSHFEQRARLIRAAHANLSFSILVAIISATFAIIYLLVSLILYEPIFFLS
ncbi:MAG TPA: hypothetical protein VJX74_15155 [Blastocatellia bacterium]|nr:hypothetical protein [Blastocatellia bacterium]